MDSPTPPVDGGRRARSHPDGRIAPGVSLICTTFNEEESVPGFLGAIFSMEALPEELVIVDGGSTDRTNHLIREFLGDHPTGISVRHVIEEKCNLRFIPGPIARGRNIAIGIAGGGIIAVTDAGCTVHPLWLRNILEPFGSGAGVDVVGGWYLPDGRSRLARCIGMAWLIPPGAVSPDNLMPSSRSLAFRREAWMRAGGYPEHTMMAEDTMFNLRLHASGAKFSYAPDAIVYWRVPESLVAFVRLVLRYGNGDGLNRIMADNPAKILARLGVAATLIFLAFKLHPAFLAALLFFWTGLAVRHHYPQLLRGRLLLSLPCLIGVKLAADISYLAGYVSGLLLPGRSEKRS